MNLIGMRVRPCQKSIDSGIGNTDHLVAMRDGRSVVIALCGPDNLGLRVRTGDEATGLYREFWDWHYSHFEVWHDAVTSSGWRPIRLSDITDTRGCRPLGDDTPTTPDRRNHITGPATQPLNPEYSAQVNQALEERGGIMDTRNEPGDARLNLDYLTQFPNALAAVAAVLQHGDEKHPGQVWRGESVTHHRGKALGHIGRSHPVLGRDYEKESGLPHMAHAVARLLMALENMSNKENGDD